MSNAGEISILFKYSPKPEKMLGEISSKFEVMDGVDIDDRTLLEKLSETRWTVLPKNH